MNQNGSDVGYIVSVNQTLRMHDQQTWLTQAQNFVGEIGDRQTLFEM